MAAGQRFHTGPYMNQGASDAPTQLADKRAVQLTIAQLEELTGLVFDEVVKEADVLAKCQPARPRSLEGDVATVGGATRGRAMAAVEDLVLAA